MEEREWGIIEFIKLGVSWWRDSFRLSSFVLPAVWQCYCLVTLKSCSPGKSQSAFLHRMQRPRTSSRPVPTKQNAFTGASQGLHREANIDTHHYYCSMRVLISWFDPGCPRHRLWAQPLEVLIGSSWCLTGLRSAIKPPYDNVGWSIQPFSCSIVLIHATLLKINNRPFLLSIYAMRRNHTHQ